MIKEKGIGRFAQQEVDLIDLDDYLPEVVSDGVDDMIRDRKTGEIFIPMGGGDWSEHFDFAGFYDRFHSATDSHKLVVVVGLHMADFFEKVRSFRPNLRIRVSTDTGIGRMRVLRRDGYTKKYVDSLNVIEKSNDLARDIPINLTIDNSEPLVAESELKQVSPSALKFVSPDFYGAEQEAIGFRITNENEFEPLS